MGNSLLVQGNIPTHCHILPGLSLLQALVVVSFQLDKRPKDVLVDVCIIVPAASSVAHIKQYG